MCRSKWEVFNFFHNIKFENILYLIERGFFTLRKFKIFNPVKETEWLHNEF